MKLTCLGIRHHGPGSARAVAVALEELKPDVVLVEQPSDTEEAIAQIARPDLVPPVALLAYNPENLKQASFYPFAHFSPEWVAFQHCLRTGTPYQCFDLPAQHTLALREAELPAQAVEAVVAADPLAYLASLDGCADGESWWDSRFEAQANPLEVFAVIEELMTELRRQTPESPTSSDEIREAHMRETLRKLAKQGFERPAVVCGAWHVPALDLEASRQADRERLKGLPKVKLSVSWIPWTYDRLAARSGYAAGVLSPAWYEILFDQEHHERAVSHWAVRAAHLLRSHQFDVSPAHAIEVVRLSRALAALSGQQLPGVPELMSAAQAVMCQGYPEPALLVEQRLIVGSRMGQVPADQEGIPLQRDIDRIMKSLRLKFTPEAEILELDLRKDSHLERSKFLHRLDLLGLCWGQELGVSGKQGSFHERWEVSWQPEQALRVIEAGVWGNTLAEASAHYVAHVAANSESLAELAALLLRTLKADLPACLPRVLQAIEDLAALSSDADRLLDALPPLAEVARYGNVRQTDAAQVLQALEQLTPRLFIALPLACVNLDEQAERLLWPKLTAADLAFRMLDVEGWNEDWRKGLETVADNGQTAPMIAGGTTRLLHDLNRYTIEETLTRLQRALSPAVPPKEAARWIEGFLGDSLLLLVYSVELFDALRGWLAQLDEAQFRELAPLLRRAFSAFPAPERDKLLDFARRPGGAQPYSSGPSDIAEEQARPAVDAFSALLQNLFNADSSDDSRN